MTETPVTYSAADDWDAAMGKTESELCPGCHGRGQYAVIYCPGCRWKTVQCSMCSGAGNVSNSIMKRVELGKRLRDIRVQRMVTVRDVANDVGSTPVQISHMEHGKEDPSAEYLAWCGVEKEMSA